MNNTPDVEAVFEFNHTKTRSVQSGYRPAHLIKDNCLTSGEHHYYEVESVAPGETAKGTITFISPEAYPHCLWIGKKINIQEGARIVGYATITDIYNPLLQFKQSENRPLKTPNSDGDKPTMRKEYKLLLFLFVVEFFVVSILNERNIKIHSWIGNAIGIFIFLLPIQILLFMLGRDEKFSPKKRVWFKIAFWFIITCYLLGGIASLL